MISHNAIAATFAANDDTELSDLVGAHLAARRMQSRLVLGVAVLASVVLAATIWHGYVMMQEIPDITTFAFRV